MHANPEHQTEKSCPIFSTLVLIYAGDGLLSTRSVLQALREEHWATSSQKSLTSKSTE